MSSLFVLVGVPVFVESDDVVAFKFKLNNYNNTLNQCTEIRCFIYFIVLKSIRT